MFINHTAQITKGNKKIAKKKTQNTIENISKEKKLKQSPKIIESLAYWLAIITALKLKM